MPLSAEQEKALRAAATEAGADPDEVVKAAEDELGDSEPAKKPNPEVKSDAPARPVADRLLVGFLPFIKVKELRALWLGLPDGIPDDELTCIAYQLKYGSSPSGAPSGGSGAEE